MTQRKKAPPATQLIASRVAGGPFRYARHMERHEVVLNGKPYVFKAPCGWKPRTYQVEQGGELVDMVAFETAMNSGDYTLGAAFSVAPITVQQLA